MRRPSAETFHEKIESQNIIIERLREDNQALLKSADALLDEVELLKEDLANLRKLVGEILGTANEEPK